MLQKDLGVLEQGILEGRKTFTNMLKYIKITASSNFGSDFNLTFSGAYFFYRMCKCLFTVFADDIFADIIIKPAI